MMPFQTFQDALNNYSSEPTSQNIALSNLPRCLKQQKLKTYIPQCCLSKSSKMPQTAKAQNLNPKVLPSQILQDASNSKSSKPTSQIVAFSNFPRCLKRQKLKTYIPKFCLPKSSKMPQTATAQNLHPKMMPFQIFQDASNSKSAQTYIPKCCFFKSFKMPQTAKAQNLDPKMMPFKFSEMPKTTKAQNQYPKMLPKASNIRKMPPKIARTQNQHPKMWPFQIFQVASNSKRSKPTSKNVAFPNLPRCLKQQKLKTYLPK